MTDLEKKNMGTLNCELVGECMYVKTKEEPQQTKSSIVRRKQIGKVQIGKV